MRAAWAEDGIKMKGPGFDVRGNTQLPRPIQKPHPPIWVGGNARRAMRRAVEFGQGWLPMMNPPTMAEMVRSPILERAAELKEKVDWVQAQAREAGRPPLEISIGAGGLGRFGTKEFTLERWLAHVAGLKQAGVTVVSTDLPATSTSQLLENITRFGEEVLPRLP